MEAVKYKHTTSSYGLTFSCRSGMLFITLPSGRNLAYVKPKVGTNKFGGECITYEGIGSTKKWELLDSYGPKFVENIVQETSRDILCYAMKRWLLQHCHASMMSWSLKPIRACRLTQSVSRWPDATVGKWPAARADGYETEFYKDHLLRQKRLSPPVESRNGR